MDPEDATATPRSPVSCTVVARGHTVVQDKPPASGGGDEGMMASELLLASLLSCQLSTFHKVAKKRRTDLAAESLHGVLHFDDHGDIIRVALEWVLSGAADDGQRDTVLRLTEKACTISRVLDVPTDLAHRSA